MVDLDVRSQQEDAAKCLDPVVTEDVVDIDFVHGVHEPPQGGPRRWIGHEVNHALHACVAPLHTTTCLGKRIEMAKDALQFVEATAWTGACEDIQRDSHASVQEIRQETLCDGILLLEIRPEDAIALASRLHVLGQPFGRASRPIPHGPKQRTLR
ncbi:Aste57867_3008 [Aphanomyces stellatus]|uniref:Aste57867_3008 protein n=1 Tax=Aphanomyces stellatus TaxID=120398 RepID=A0A485KEH9_9STRA|nr:hypothetical protein As57867_002999 [Aphanomyces stellatus]VFT80189.1 Aste57867_3008 [Aphanomyces stellatus]